MNEEKLIEVLEQLNMNLEVLKFAIEEHEHDKLGNPTTQEIIHEQYKNTEVYRDVAPKIEDLKGDDENER